MLLLDVVLGKHRNGLLAHFFGLVESLYLIIVNYQRTIGNHLVLVQLHKEEAFNFNSKLFDVGSDLRLFLVYMTWCLP